MKSASKILMILDCNDADSLHNQSNCGFVSRLCLQTLFE